MTTSKRTATHSFIIFSMVYQCKYPHILLYVHNCVRVSLDDDIKKSYGTSWMIFRHERERERERERQREKKDVSNVMDENHGCYATLTYTKSKLHEEKCIKNLHSRDPVFAHFVMCLRNTCKQGGEGPRMRKLIEILCMHFQREFDRNGEKIEAEQSIGRVNITSSFRHQRQIEEDFFPLARK